MAHQLDYSKGRAAIAYAKSGGTPWHGEGTAMEEGAPLDEWRLAAGLDYEVKTHDIRTHEVADDEVSESGGIVQYDLKVPRWRALVRSDNNAILTVVSDRYRVVQPRTVVEFFRELIDKMGFKMEAMGALADGKRVWATARTGQDFAIKNDLVETYLLLCTSYDRKFATTGKYVAERVICHNTLDMALDENSVNVFKVGHNTEFDPDTMKLNLGLLDATSQDFQSTVWALVNTPISPEDAEKFFLELAGANLEIDTLETCYLARKFLQCYQEAPGQDLITARNTLWGVLNGVTYFADHERRARDDSARQDSAWFGSGRLLKNRAFQKLVAMSNQAVLQ